jgi:hypothetical protein
VVGLTEDQQPTYQDETSEGPSAAELLEDCKLGFLEVRVSLPSSTIVSLCTYRCCAGYDDVRSIATIFIWLLEQRPNAAETVPSWIDLDTQSQLSSSSFLVDDPAIAFV